MRHALLIGAAAAALFAGRAHAQYMPYGWAPAYVPYPYPYPYAYVVPVPYAAPPPVLRRPPIRPRVWHRVWHRRVAEPRHRPLAVHRIRSLHRPMPLGRPGLVNPLLGPLPTR